MEPSKPSSVEPPKQTSNEPVKPVTPSAEPTQNVEVKVEVPDQRLQNEIPVVQKQRQDQQQHQKQILHKKQQQEQQGNVIRQNSRDNRLDKTSDEVNRTRAVTSKPLPSQQQSDQSDTSSGVQRKSVLRLRTEKSTDVPQRTAEPESKVKSSEKDASVQESKEISPRTQKDKGQGDAETIPMQTETISAADKPEPMEEGNLLSYSSMTIYHLQYKTKKGTITTNSMVIAPFWLSTEHC